MVENRGFSEKIGVSGGFMRVYRGFNGFPRGNLDK